MNFSQAVKNLGISMGTACAALGSAFALGGALQSDYSSHSHQRPTPERWIESRTSRSPQLIAYGRKIFLESCAHCHGADARGDEGPDLHDVQTSDRYIGNLITHGIPHEMPSFAKKHQSADIVALIAYLRSLDPNEGS